MDHGRHVRTARTWLLGLLLLSGAGSTLVLAGEGNEAPVPELRPGDRWDYRKSGGPGTGTVMREVLRAEDGLLVESVVIEEQADHPTQGRVTSRTEQVVRRQADDHALVSLGSHAVATLAGTNETAAEHSVRAEYEPPLRQFEFPFGVGDAWTVASTERVERDDGADTERELRYAVDVVGAEEVRTVAGFFDAFIVEVRDESEGSADGSLERLWWAPAACGYVQREIEEGGSLLAAYELTDVTCQAPAPSGPLDEDGDARGTSALGVAAAVALFFASGWKRKRSP